jgi:hypothetical protein
MCAPRQPHQHAVPTPTKKECLCVLGLNYSAPRLKDTILSDQFFILVNNKLFLSYKASIRTKPYVQEADIFIKKYR